MSAREVSGNRLVLVADIVGSSDVPNLRDFRDRALRKLSEDHLEAGLVLARYTVTAWDEFENVAPRLRDLPRIVRELRIRFFPRQLRIGLGWGEISEDPTSDTPINEASSGEAFVVARGQLDFLQGPWNDPPQMTCFGAPSEALTAWVNCTYLLMDTLWAGQSKRQQETIQAYEEAGTLEAAAKILGVKDESTVSRNLKRAHYPQIQAASRELRRLLDEYPDLAP